MLREDLRDQTEETFGLGGVTQAVVARQKGESPGFLLANGQSRRQLEGIRSAEWMRP
jgi:hypothetical protein